MCSWKSWLWNRPNWISLGDLCRVWDDTNFVQITIAAACLMTMAEEIDHWQNCGWNRLSASCFIDILVNSYLRPDVRPSTIEWKTTRQENSSAPSFKHSVKLKFFISFRLFICEKWKLICILRQWCLLYDVNGPGKSRDRRPHPSCFLLISTSNYVM